MLSRSTCGRRLEEVLREHGVQQLIFAGVTADVCVHTTLREATDRGFDCWYATDAVGTPDDTIRKACELMVEHEGGVWGWLATVAEIAVQLGPSSPELVHVLE